LILQHTHPTHAMFRRTSVRQSFRNAFFKGAIVAVPALALQALLLTWVGQTAWALLPVAVALLVSTAYTVIAHAADHRPLAATAITFGFAAAYSLVMALGFGGQFGFHFLLIALLPLVLVWERAGDAGKWAAAAALCFFTLWIEFRDGSAFLLHSEATASQASLFRFSNMALALLLLVAFTRIVLDFRKDDMRRDAPAIASSRLAASLPDRRRLTDALSKPHLHFMEPDRVFSVIVLEVDHHAAIAEIFGRLTAEQIARQASAMILGKVRETDMISRQGRRAFLIFLPETVEEEAHTVAERIRIAIAEMPLIVGDLSLRVSVTLGIAQSRASADVTMAIADAEKAMATGQAGGRNRTMLAGLL